MIRALIVDDEPSVAAIIKHFIDKKDLPISVIGWATNGKEATELIQTENPDLVYLDIQMPIMNGFEVMSSFPNSNYIVVTAHESFQFAQQALRLGAKDIILKPIDYKQMMQSISRVIGWQFTSNHVVNSALEYIHRHYAEKIEVAQLAQLLFTTPSHIARLFKKYMGIGVISYINKIRISRAIEMIENGELSIKEIAEFSGYENLNNFYKHFKAHTGTTPATYSPKKMA